MVCSIVFFPSRLHSVDTPKSAIRLQKTYLYNRKVLRSTRLLYTEESRLRQNVVEWVLDFVSRRSPGWMWWVLSFGPPAEKKIALWDPKLWISARPTEYAISGVSVCLGYLLFRLAIIWRKWGADLTLINRSGFCDSTAIRSLPNKKRCMHPTINELNL